jgi:hypothetical protein
VFNLILEKHYPIPDEPPAKRYSERKCSWEGFFGFKGRGAGFVGAVGGAGVVGRD